MQVLIAPTVPEDTHLPRHEAVRRESHLLD
jgi:hypothetical protein